ncbi:hypothetical protein BZA70DRAFT_291118 [Myxozyma melibiosi]|uniref:PH domain-containing protein n=1 Tax=Myxozyma melibiosi TaxID=54550 RepID=A0ABR1F111_9ASCO
MSGATQPANGSFARLVPPTSPAAGAGGIGDLVSVSPHTVLSPQLHANARVDHLRLSADTERSGSVNNDLVIRSGWLMKRGRRWTWSRRWFVLRPTQLSWYKDDTEYKVSSIIPIDEINTAAVVSDHKSHSSNHKTHFAVFTPSRNYHLHATSEQDAQAWTYDNRTVISININSSNNINSPRQNNDALGYGFPRSGSQRAPHAAQSTPTIDALAAEEASALASMDPPALEAPSLSRNMSSYDGTSIISARTMSLHNGSTYDFSGPEDIGFSSGASDCGGDTVQSPEIVTDINDNTLQGGGSMDNYTPLPAPALSGNDKNVEQDLAQLENDRVIHSGYLLRLVKRYNQWRRKWVVLRKGSLCFYKSDDEYKLLKLIPLESIIDVMEVDPISRTKQYCMQIILPDKRVRLCSNSEDDLTKWLVAIKNAISRRKREIEQTTSSGDA